MTAQGVRVGLTAACIGIIYGYDLGGIAGVLLFIDTDFGLDDSQKQLLTTMVVLGQIVGTLSGGVLADAVGRKRSLVACLAGYAVFAVLGATAVSLPVLLVARLFLGAAIGVSIVVVPVYVAESAPASVRGSLLTAYQFTILAGIIVGYLAGYLFAPTQNWRWLLGLAAAPAVVLLAMLARVSDTANWYLLKGRTEDARRALARIEPADTVEATLDGIAAALNERRGSIGDMLRKPYLRATVFVVVLGFLVQITGINAIIYYSPKLFEAMGFEGNFGRLALPAMVQVGALAAVGVSLSLVDRLGRRPILLAGIAAMIAADAVVIAAGTSDGTAARILGFGGVLLFIIGFNFGFGSLVWVFAGESFPSHLRSLGSSAMQTSNLTANAVIAGFTLTMLNRIGMAGMFAVFGLFAVIAFLVVYRFAPETRGRQLEDIRYFWENGGRWPASDAGPTDPS
ncbi:sugar porter family MFS transporter [Mycobacterium sp.]|uniref:sugar porter family MFS transporter n=1 Tax=Mycobacterium sp. TaxID=1785 RepID=UPI003A89948D